MKRNIIVLIAAGVMAFALYCGSIEFAQYIIPSAWLGGVLKTFKEWGIPAWFLYGYIAFVWQYIRSWFLLGVLSFGIGISNISWGKRFAVMLAVWLPVVDFLFMLLYCLQGGDGIDSYHDAVHVLFSFRLRFITLWAIPIGIGAWYLGTLCQRLSKRQATPATPTPPACPGNLARPRSERGESGASIGR